MTSTDSSNTDSYLLSPDQS